ncbi:TPA: hypothetical protein NOS95_002682 [Pseudomonas aeruginosa]|nr:hypothetical protein [Pseudomonas aeruginosa]HCI1996724.1 hypothetical protein [Pseudomonas aeruginosa]HCI2252488.1 hypothetical protein [Pseudomonas aeruginosa]HCI2626925.1 hypothetical protein [Pseudomonas aeruginosa]
MSIDWSKANGSAVAALIAKKNNIHYPGFEFVSGYHRTGCMIRATSADDGSPLSAPEDVWEIVDRPVTWNGQGLPPVGTVCEYLDTNLEWHEVEIFGIDKAQRRIFASPWMTMPYMGCSAPECFRPIRTPEQIAAEERSKECDRIFVILSSVEREGNRSDMAEALYDAGYRRQEEGK